MDTIKSYLETMFANLPATAEVLKAKDELWGMMEDKYNELISEGKSENEAVGTVISQNSAILTNSQKPSDLTDSLLLLLITDAL